MIKKFRIRFIAVAMASIFVVLAVILGVMNVVNYRRVVREADNTLQILMENDGKFPEQQPGDNPAKKAEEENDSETDVLENNTSTDNIDEKKQSPPEKPEDDNEDDSEKGDSGNNSPEMNGTDKNDEPRMSPELPFESRYFTVVLDSDNKKVSADIGKIAAVNEKTAVKYAKTVAKKSKTSGFYSGYRYMVEETNGEKMIIFLDTGRNLGTFYSFLITSIAASFGGMLAVLILVIVLSKRIVKPVIESYEKQKRFITDAGHEIKTPLTVIDADAEVLEMEVGDDNEWLKDIRKQTVKLKELTNNLIYLSRMEESQENVVMIDFPISDIVEETASSFQALAVTQEKTFDCEIEPMLTCYGNEQNIQRLLEILLDNALKYSNPGGHISVELKKYGKGISLSVYNTAEYVSRENISHIFERFYRLDESRNSKTGGYGIGLSIASAIVQAHKGKITAETKDEKSLKITVLI